MSRVVTGDALDWLRNAPAESVHAIVTDPPYGLAFMGRDWDDFEPREYQKWCEEWAGLAMRVLKPGGHLLAFGGDRTHDLSQSGIRFAGYEIRPFMAWIHGQGFPKALDVGKAIDKAAGAEREVMDTYEVPDITGGNYGQDKEPYSKRGGNVVERTTPATDAAKKWDGWKTALKPAIEPITCARKPFSGTVAENVQAHGTGALNIGETRIHGDTSTGYWPSQDENHNGEISDDHLYGNSRTVGDADPAEGRYPANVIFDAEAAEALDREVGEKPTGKGSGASFGGGGDNTHEGWTRPSHESYKKDETSGYGDNGGPSRYFYTSKATRAERTLDGKIDNAHPTVKPIDLMEWLVKLVTAEGQTVLDPFCGTGTTCRAAKNLGRDFIGIEQDSKWADVARARCGLTPNDPSVLTPDGQTTLTD